MSKQTERQTLMAPASSRCCVCALSLLFFLFSTGCAKISGSFTHLVHAPDFLRSEISSDNTAVADGASVLPVYVHLMNSDKTVVSGYKPQFKLLSGARLSSDSNCFQSDINGLSICYFKSTVIGQRKIKITNIAQVDLTSQITFLAVSPKTSQMQIVSGSDQKAQTPHYKVHATVGNTTSNPVILTQHYKVYGSIQGALTHSNGSL